MRKEQVCSSESSSLEFLKGFPSLKAVHEIFNRVNSCGNIHRRCPSTQSNIFTCCVIKDNFLETDIRMYSCRERERARERGQM